MSPLAELDSFRLIRFSITARLCGDNAAEQAALSELIRRGIVLTWADELH